MKFLYWFAGFMIFQAILITLISVTEQPFLWLYVSLGLDGGMAISSPIVACCGLFNE
jgi:hypothetical protein